MIPFRGPYVGGRFIRPERLRSVQVKRDPGNTDRVIGEWMETPEAVEAAIESAAKAYPDWAWAKDKERIDCLRRLQATFKENLTVLADTISSEMGKVLSESLAEVDSSIKKIDVVLQEALKLIASTEKKDREEFYRFHPRGVLAVIGPFNFPLQLPISNLIPALATGNAVIFKPSELCPFTGQLIAECFHEAGFPKGVFNLLQGGGSHRRGVGEAPGHRRGTVCWLGCDRTSDPEDDLQ